MWYWIIAGSIFIFLEALVFLSLTPLKDKYEFFKFINDWYADKSINDISSIFYTIIALKYKNYIYILSSFFKI